MTVAIKIFPDTYVDSVVQLRGMRAMREVDGVEWASAAMATPANVETLRAEGVEPMQVSDAGASDFFLVVRATTDSIATEALAAGESAVSSSGPSPGEGGQRDTPGSLRDAVVAQPQSNVAVISVPGDYAALAAHQALSADLHVLLFSDNVPVEKEVALKDHALSRDRLMMGPGAGTALLGGVGLGFANVVTPGPVGVVAAAGTGAQEAMALLDRWGVGVSHVIGVGGRDLSSEVGGRMARSAILALREDPATKVILFVSKPPAPDVAAAVLATAGETPLVAALIGLDPEFPAPPGVVLADTLESGVTATLGVLGLIAPDTTETMGPSVDEARARLAPGRRLIRGLFSGGTLCYESLVILGRTVGRDPLQHTDQQGMGPPGAGRVPPVPGPGRGGVHAWPSAPDDRPRGAARAAPRARDGPAGRSDHPRRRPRPWCRRRPREDSRACVQSPRWPTAVPRSSPTSWAPTTTPRDTGPSAIGSCRPGASSPKPRREPPSSRPRSPPATRAW